MLGECDEGAGEKKGIQKESDKVESETKKMKRGLEVPALKVGRGIAPKKARTTTETTMDGQRRDLTGVGWEKSQR